MTTATQGSLLLAGATVLIAGCLTKTDPLTLLARWSIRIRATWLLSVQMARAAWSVRSRWGECLARARREI